MIEDIKKTLWAADSNADQAPTYTRGLIVTEQRFDYWLTGFAELNAPTTPTD